MARRRSVWDQAIPPWKTEPMDLGDALRTVFGSREELHEMFREWEAQLVETIHRACEDAKRARSAPDQTVPAAPELLGKS
jgi:inhibitor of KinA sporulation pathway (predicted exonuclease)